ncbi:IclR family transcriptional regulator [Tsukamurella sp. 1534]|uniref:IclR family transcriptional regulator n=1 Tax=Tsukamurella sp. 1534 TaxID=1151061 RepID=UPI0002D33CEE|nr:IclR family transcriptional regulator [Tsukamurella sp. 1534]
MGKLDNGSDGAAGGPPRGVQAVDRAISVLELLAREGEAGVSEVAAAIGVHKSTAFRLLSALESRELVEQNDSRGKYRLSHGILRLASTMSTRQNIANLAQPVCDALAAEVGETVNVAVIRGVYSINVCQALGPSAVGTQNWVGAPTPLHATSSGKVLLAHQSMSTADRLIRELPLEKFTGHTVTRPKLLRGQLAVIEEQGHGTSFEELEEGLNAVAVPVRDHTGSVVAALSASGPVYRFTRERIAEVTPAVITAGREISHRMGYFAREQPPRD